MIYGAAPIIPDGEGRPAPTSLTGRATPEGTMSEYGQKLNQPKAGKLPAT